MPRVAVVQLDRPRPGHHGRAGDALERGAEGLGPGAGAGPRQPHPDTGAQPGEQRDRHGSAFTRKRSTPLVRPSRAIAQMAAAQTHRTSARTS